MWTLTFARGNMFRTPVCVCVLGGAHPRLADLSCKKWFAKSKRENSLEQGGLKGAEMESNVA